MEALIPVVNKLQDVFTTVRADAVELPQIVVVGAQSSGKSSVLESFVGRDFLPRGSGIVTRRPLVLQLTHVDDYTKRPPTIPANERQEWATFLHLGDDRVFTDFNEVRREIETETSRLTGANKGISHEPISLRIYSNGVANNLTLVDLPGLTKVPVGDQPPDIEQQIRNLLLQYTTNPNSIILAVTPANVDFATSEAIKLAREVDPDGRRTLAVMTKLDLMDAGTDATDALTGDVIFVKLGIVGVVGRSQKDIMDGKSIEAALQDEARFLQRKYPTLASRHGTSYLASTLNRLLMLHIRDRLPELEARINEMLVHYEERLTLLGEVAVDKEDQAEELLLALSAFSNAYCGAIDGTGANLPMSEFSAGARINHIFHEIFAETLDELNPMAELGTRDILTTIKNVTGLDAALFVPEKAFQLLAKRLIACLERHSLHCVDQVHREMWRNVRAVDHADELPRFPRLHEAIVKTVTDLLKRRLVITNSMVHNVVAVEMAYINAKHPDFRKRAAEQWSQHQMGRFQQCGDQLIRAEMGNDRLERSIDESDSTNQTGQQDAPKSKEPWRIWPSKSGKSSGRVASNESIASSVSAAPTAVETPAKVGKQQQAAQASAVATEDAATQTMRELLECYFAVVRKNVQDLVPKTITHHLVNYVSENLHRELVSQLYRPELHDTLLAEGTQVETERKEAQDMVRVLKQASDVINEIRSTLF